MSRITVMRAARSAPRRSSRSGQNGASARPPSYGVSFADGLAPQGTPAANIVSRPGPSQQIQRQWWAHLPDCPCTNPGTATLGDGWCSEGAPSSHPGATECYREVKTTHGPGQQCCYDAHGALIVTGGGAGTPDRVGGAEGENADGSCNWNALWVTEHFAVDYLPFTRMPLDQYLEGWPPNRGSGCERGAQAPQAPRRVSRRPVPEQQIETVVSFMVETLSGADREGYGRVVFTLRRTQGELVPGFRKLDRAPARSPRGALAETDIRALVGITGRLQPVGTYEIVAIRSERAWSLSFRAVRTGR